MSWTDRKPDAPAGPTAKQRFNRVGMELGANAYLNASRAAQGVSDNADEYQQLALAAVDGFLGSLAASISFQLGDHEEIREAVRDPLKDRVARAFLNGWEEGLRRRREGDTERVFL